jgi:hypothetical protein
MACMGDEGVVCGEAGDGGKAGDGGVAGGGVGTGNVSECIEIPELSEGGGVRSGIGKGEAGAAGLDRGERSLLSTPSLTAAPPRCASSFSSSPVVILSPVGRVVLCTLAEEGSVAEELAVEGSAAARFCRLIRWWSERQNFHPQ